MLGNIFPLINTYFLITFVKEIVFGNVVENDNSFIVFQKLIRKIVPLEIDKYRFSVTLLMRINNGLNFLCMLIEL